MGALSFLLKILLSTLLGGIIGYEREKVEKPAGLRTLMLVCIGSTAFMSISKDVAEWSKYADPGRIAAGIVTGIGFLGAGVIIRAKGSVIGITTAATIWFVAAIGMAVGAGLILESILLTALGYFILEFLPFFIHKKRE